VSVAVHHSDCVAWLRAHDGPLFDACVTDPPYHLASIVKRFGGKGAAAAKVGATGAYARASRGFMGKAWDGGDVAFNPDTWRAVYDRLKPGAHLIAFSGTRTYHRMACAIEDAGFIVRDQLAWVYGSGFPKSHDVSKGIDRHNGDVREKVKVSADAPAYQRGIGNHRPWMDNPEHERDGPSAASAASAAWQGWGTALKPAWEPTCLAQKPLSEKSIAANVLKWGTGAINVDACRVGTEGGGTHCGNRDSNGKCLGHKNAGQSTSGETFHGPDTQGGRWPANICHDGSDEVLAGFPETASGKLQTHHKRNGASQIGTFDIRDRTGEECDWGGDSGSAARFFYSAKAGPLDRIGTEHATVKPVDLMRWLVRMVTPPGGHVLDPFAGSGKTGIAAMAEGFDCTMIDIEADHVADIERQLAFLRGEGRTRFEEHNAAKLKRAVPQEIGGLFAEPTSPLQSTTLERSE
jgi:site-specific DNA-methyltransferase (adenine-specific)